MVVPGDDERRRGVRGHEIGIGFVLRIAIAVIDQRVNLLAAVDAHALAAGIAASLVDVVAGVEHEVELLVGDVPKRREVAHFVVIAAAHGVANPIDAGAFCRRGFRATDLTGLAAGKEAVEILPARLKAAGLDVDAVTKLGSSNRLSRLNDRAKGAVRGDLPADLDVRGRHAAAVVRLGRQPCPQHDAVRPRVSRRDTHREGIRPEDGLRPRRPRGKGLQHGCRSQLPGNVEQLAARKPAERSVVESKGVAHGRDFTATRLPHCNSALWHPHSRHPPLGTIGTLGTFGTGTSYSTTCSCRTFATRFGAC